MQLLQRYFMGGMLAVWLMLLAGPATGADYYVDSAAAGGGDGSEGSPWNTLSQVNAAMGTFNSGDHIKLKRGGTWYESLQVTAAGTVYESYGTGALPVIDGSQAVSSASWTQESTSIYSSALAAAPRILFYDGVPVLPITSLRFSSVPAELAANAVLLQMSPYSSFWVRSVSGNLVSGITNFEIDTNTDVYVRQVENNREIQWPSPLGKPTVVQETAGLTALGQWYWSGGRIYMYSDTHPGDKVRVSRTDGGGPDEDGIRIGVSNVTIQDLRIQRQNKQGVVVFNGANNTVSRVEIFGCGKSGIQVWNSGSNIISNNNIDSCSGGIALEAGTITLNEVNDNTVSNCRGACIGLSGIDVAYNTVYGNKISGANSMSYDGAGIYTYNAGRNTIKANTIRDCGSVYLRSAGIMVDVSTGGSTQEMTIESNTIENNSTAGIAVSGAGHTVKGNSLKNNGAEFMPGRAQLQFFASGAAASGCNVIWNTIQADLNRHFIVASDDSIAGHYIDYNRYEGKAEQQFYWNGQWLEFSDWQDNTGHDLNSSLSLGQSVLVFIPAIIGGIASTR